MKQTFTALVMVAVACPAAFGAAGGPSPGVVQGGSGVLASRAGIRYVALPAGRSTIVAAIRVNGGQIIRLRSLRGVLGVPMVAYDGTTSGLSRDGRRLVLASSVGVPTRFVVLSVPRLKVVRQVALPGRFAFDALSPSGRTLYLIQLLRNGGRYRVRAYDVEAGRLLARPVVDPAIGNAPMTGVPMARATSASGRWAYTLYQQASGPGFVHALDTVARKAVCVGLLRRGARLRLDGGRLAVLGERGRRVGLIDTRTLRVVR